MNTIKAIYYVENEKYREAVPLLKKGMKANPYLYLSEAVLGEAYTKLGMSDSAIYYSKIAHEASPKNSLHFGNYLFSLAAINDSITIKETFKSLDPELTIVLLMKYILVLWQILLILQVRIIP